jgi:hypothetical protein
MKKKWGSNDKNNKKNLCVREKRIFKRSFVHKNIAARSQTHEGVARRAVAAVCYAEWS